MTRWLRLAGLPAVALALVAVVLGVQVAHGGGSYEPLRPADPCVARSVTAPTDLDGVTERVVLLGLDGAACRLHTTREALTLELAGPGQRTDAEIQALHAGLLSAVQRLQHDGDLPPASALVDEALDASDLNGFVKAAIRALPDSVIDSALHTDDVLTRTVDDLDLRALLANLGDQGDLERQIDAAVTQAVKQALVARLRGLLP
ncbi:MAG: hypothetical protein QM747_22105 [Nocardioides sp.]